MPKGFYKRSKKYRQDMSVKMLEVMNRPEIKLHQKKMALKRWEKKRNLPIKEIEPIKVVEPKDNEAIEIAKDFINNEIHDENHARVIMKELESVNNKERVKEDDFDTLETEDLKRMAEELESEFSILGLYDEIKKAFPLSLQAERTRGRREKYITMLRELSKHREKLEEAKRKRRGE